MFVFGYSLSQLLDPMWHYARRVPVLQRLSSRAPRRHQIPVHSSGIYWFRTPDTERTTFKNPTSVEDAVAQGLTVRAWQGCTTEVITDGVVHLGMMLAPPSHLKSSSAPEDRLSNEPPERLMKQPAIFVALQSHAARTARPPGAESINRFNGGFTWGGGAQAPHEFRWSGVIARVANKIVTNPAVQTIAVSASDLFQVHAPTMYQRYRSMLMTMMSEYGFVNWFSGGVFAAFTFNIGPSVCTWPHRDFHNLAGGWCAITALGNYDYRRGGHLILWDLRIAIEFPPGCTILIPSALLVHSNIPVKAGETRYSLTQYSAGHLWRWIDNGFQKDGLRSPKQRAADARRMEESIAAFPPL